MGKFLAVIRNYENGEYYLSYTAIKPVPFEGEALHTFWKRPVFNCERSSHLCIIPLSFFNGKAKIFYKTRNEIIPIL